MNDRTSQKQDPAHVAQQTGAVLHAAVTEQPLEELLAQAREDTATDAMGAVVTFEGVVRDHDGGALVDALTYTAHPDVDAEMQRVVSEVVAANPEIRAWVAHRVGPLKIGEMAFLVVVAAAHRGPAFAAVAELADRVKSEVPIWKEQAMTGGDTQWVGL